MRTINRRYLAGVAPVFCAVLDEFGEALAALLVGRRGIERALCDHHVALPDVGVVTPPAQPVTRECRASASRCAATRSSPPAHISTRYRRLASAVPSSPATEVTVMMCPDFCAAHHRQHSLGHGHVAEEVGFELMAKLGQRHVFGESGHAESGIVYQHIDAVMIADELLPPRPAANRIQ